MVKVNKIQERERGVRRSKELFVKTTYFLPIKYVFKDINTICYCMLWWRDSPFHLHSYIFIYNYDPLS